MSLTIDLDYLKDIENQDFKIDPLKFQKMLFLFNTIEDGWSVKKKDDNYVFTKKNNPYDLSLNFLGGVNVISYVLGPLLIILVVPYVSDS